MNFGDGVGASLVRGPYCQLDVGLCDVDVFLHWNSAAEEGAGVGLQSGEPNRITDIWLLGDSSFWIL